MAQITLRGNAINTVGELPAVGSPAPAFTLTGGDLGVISSDQFRGKSVLLNIFPSVDTPVCATSVRTFDERAAASGATVLCVSKDLPFAQKRFCGAEGTENVMPASAFRDSFGEDYGVTIADGPMAGLLARAIVVIGADGNVAYTELVPEIAQENPTTKRRWPRWAPRLSQAPRVRRAAHDFERCSRKAPRWSWPGGNTGAGRAPT